MYTDLDGEWMLRAEDVDDMVVETVRLSEAELAAQLYWFWIEMVLRKERDPEHDFTTELEFEEVLHRFATLPDASEKDYQ